MLAPADLNGDDWPDLAVTANRNYFVAAFAGNRDGTVSVLINNTP